MLDWIQHFRYRAAGEGLPKGAYLRGSAARPLRDRTQVLAACHSRATLAALCRPWHSLAQRVSVHHRRWKMPVVVALGALTAPGRAWGKGRGF